MFKPQLSEDIINCKNEITFPKLASIKLDGLRGVTKFGSLLSRSLKKIPNEHIQETLAPYTDLDGEIIVGKWNAPDVRRATSSGARSIDGKPDFKFYVFDDLSTDGTFEQRLEILRKRELPEFIVVLEQRLVNSLDELNAFYAEVLADGHEGLILRNPTSLYKHGRYSAASQESLKMKPFADDEFVVTGFFEAMHNTNEAFTNELGRTARSSDMTGLIGNGMIGGFLGKDVKTGKDIKVAAGKLTHAERTYIFRNQEQFLNRVGTYRHMPHGVKNMPNFARFVCWRDSFDMGE